MNSHSEFQNFIDILLRRRWVILCFAAVLLSTVAVGTFMQTPVYQATAMLLIEKERQNYSSSREGGFVDASQKDYYQSQNFILKSRSLIQRVIETLKLDQDPRFRGTTDLIERVQRMVLIDPIANTRLVHVRAESTDPDLAARIANALSELYVAQHQEARLFMSQDVLQNLDAGTGAAAMETIESLPSVVDNRLIQELKISYAAKESELANLQRRYTPKHPSIVQLTLQISTLRARIDREVRMIANSIKAELSGELKGNNVRIIDRAEVPREPVRPRKALNLALGAFFGLFLGVGLAVLIDRLDLTIKTQEDVENLLKLPFLGAIPTIDGAKTGKTAPYRYAAELADSVTAEAFRTIRTSLSYASPNGAPKTLVVTSSVTGEGKSVVSCNLAIVFAQLGEKVLLIDGDLRKPMIHRAFRLPDDKGVTTHLVRGQELESLLLDGPVENLKVLVCGPRPPDPSELLSSPRLARMLDWAKERFDRVIIDATPIFPVSDAIILAKHSNGIVFVSHSTAVSAAMAARGVGRLRASKLPLLGGVINRVVYQAGNYHYYYHYHADDTRRSGGETSKPEASVAA